MAKVGHIAVEVRPTVTLESAVACVTMLNLFLADDDTYRLEVGNDGKWRLTDEPLVPATGGIYKGKPVLSNDDKEVLAGMPFLKSLCERAGLEV